MMRPAPAAAALFAKPSVQSFSPETSFYPTRTSSVGENAPDLSVFVFLSVEGRFVRPHAGVFFPSVNTKWLEASVGLSGRAAAPVGPFSMLFVEKRCRGQMGAEVGASHLSWETSVTKSTVNALKCHRLLCFSVIY